MKFHSEILFSRNNSPLYNVHGNHFSIRYIEILRQSMCEASCINLNLLTLLKSVGRKSSLRFVCLLIVTEGMNFGKLESIFQRENMMLQHGISWIFYLSFIQTFIFFFILASDVKKCALTFFFLLLFYGTEKYFVLRKFFIWWRLW